MKAGWVGTASGRLIDLRRPTPELVDPYDVAWHLSGIYRWVGATRINISVAQHSILVASLFEDPEDRLAALLHDGQEYLLGDISKPLKALLPGWRELEDGWARAVRARFGVERYPEDRIRVADQRVLLAEAKQWAHPNQADIFERNGIDPTLEPAEVTVDPWTRGQAFALFREALGQTIARAGVAA